MRVLFRGSLSELQDSLNSRVYSQKRVYPFKPNCKLRYKDIQENKTSTPVEIVDDLVTEVHGIYLEDIIVDSNVVSSKEELIPTEIHGIYLEDIEVTNILNKSNSIMEDNNSDEWFEPNEEEEYEVEKDDSLGGFQEAFSNFMRDEEVSEENEVLVNSEEDLVLEDDFIFEEDIIKDSTSDLALESGLVFEDSLIVEDTSNGLFDSEEDECFEELFDSEVLEQKPSAKVEYQNSINNIEKPKSIRDYIKIYKNPEYKEVCKLYSKSEVDKLIAQGKVYKKNGRLMI